MKVKVWNKFEKGGGKNSKDKSGKPKGGKASIPDNEFQEMQKLGDQKMRCRYWNSSVGCARGDDCSFKHECMKCGDKKHNFVHFHMGL